MKNVLYIGNALSNKGRTTTTIETLGNHLGEVSNIKIASSKLNKALRLLDMIQLVVSNKSNADYVLIDTYSTSNFYFAFVISQICRSLNLKYIPILHGGNLENRLIKSPRLSKAIFRNAYKLIAPSNFLKAIFQSYSYKDVLYMPNSINIDEYHFENRSIDTIKLLWVRSFSSIYNPELAILVLEDLLEKGYEAELTMIGPEVDGSLASTKNLVKSKNLEVIFTGKLSKQQWTQLAKNCNIFVNTTNFDNTPVSVIEAMALGLPIVSTNVGGLPFLITDGVDGLLVPPNSIEFMTDAIIKIKKEKDLKDTLVVNARQKVEQFDWKVVKPKWKSLLS
jgi:glycosyltransferase involved in cell wall biosynthesis